jgi:hypothetical protein
MPVAHASLAGFALEIGAIPVASALLLRLPAIGGRRRIALNGRRDFAGGSTRRNVLGANSSQGWYLFIFLMGFTFFPAGIMYLGPIFTIVGAIMLIASAVGFYRLKKQEEQLPQNG